ncbi:hypothetical protein LZ554_000226 [Drepanopeziza brunnea f. sp. 'monogermtubi']|nr:hypothetical protein LZ554_000226 [Drepanopeziza brunnea f. sp. 'monogermtubi']
MLQSKSIFAVLLALSLLFGEAHGHWWSTIVIGYSRVSPEKASRINADNKIHIEEGSPEIDKLGPGFYLGQEPTYRHFSEALDGIFVPEEYWIHGLFQEPNQRAYIEWFTQRNPDKQLRFSYIEGTNAGQMRMAIPNSLIMNNALKLWAQCYESEAKLRDSLKDFRWFIDWDDRWLINEE